MIYEVMNEQETIIKKYGYEYHLVRSQDRSNSKIPEPCFMGMQGFALKSCNKIGEDPTKSKKKVKYTRKRRIKL